MLLKQNTEVISLVNKDTKLEFLLTGDVYQFTNGNILINQFLGNCIDGSMNNIYLRVYNMNKIDYIPLLGNKSRSKIKYNSNNIIWYGNEYEIDYEVILTLVNESTWFWDINIKGTNKTIDIVYGQDISISNRGATLTNELYMCQYIDHKVIDSEYGYAITSRQNQQQNSYLLQGSLNTKVIGFSTDAMQFFGEEYKITNTPKALKGNLENVNYQFETAYIALQTEKIDINGEKKITFYNVYKQNKIEFNSELNNIKQAYAEKTDNNFNELNKVELNNKFGKPIVSEFFNDSDINKYFPSRKLEEIQDGKLLSFFNNTAHIVLSDKEIQVERPHGHIITSGISTKELNTELITSTNYMMGIFNSQLVVGNTSLNKFLSTPRGLINYFKTSGQRIYIKIDDKYCILTMPAAYELGVNYAKWFYKLKDDCITIVSYTALDRADIILEIKSEKSKQYEYIITNQLVMGSNEFEQDVELEDTDNKIKVYAAKDTFLSNVYPDINYTIDMKDTKFEIDNDKIFFTNGKSFNGTLLTISTEPTTKLQIVISGRLEQVNLTDVKYDLEEEKIKFANLYNDLTCGFKLELKGNTRVEKLNEIIKWYTHNAMVHYAVPHGLEQPGGAAWGTRDVCQGPVEYFLATQHYSLTKKIIEEVFAHQFLEAGEWPQWFMFDRYNMQQDDWHGDVVFWPLKIVGDYIKTTNDYSLLDSEVVYRHLNGQITDFKETILEHIKKAVKSIYNRFLYDTALISYDGGDWDDTLQPANKNLKEKLVSSWTVALAYQVINQLKDILAKRDKQYSDELFEASEKIKTSFNQYLIKDNVITGFAYCPSQNTIEYMLHPEDNKTGIHYRLLPMTRSIISELVTKEQAQANSDIIDKYLKFPDGVRLMDRPARYKGGDVEFFQRAEQAANVGREISLQYIHAHIRYIEAMAKLGKPNEVLKSLMIVNPINITEEVKNAMIRQSNTYFSSSEGAFNDRYQFQNEFDRLYDGSIKVKGGWRIYSSGSGIYLNQLISNVLGVRFEKGNLILDPVLDSSLNGLVFDYTIYNKPVRFIYNIKKDGVGVEKIILNGNVLETQTLTNCYRKSGVSITKECLLSNINGNNVIEIYLD